MNMLPPFVVKFRPPCKPSVDALSGIGLSIGSPYSTLGEIMEE